MRQSQQVSRWAAALLLLPLPLYFLAAVIRDPGPAWRAEYRGITEPPGAGVVVAEIQTPSDPTFRVYDWGRSGPGRELHIDQALECIRFGPQPPIPHKPHKPIEVDGIRTTPLLSTDHFSVERVDALTNAEFRIVTSGLPEIWMMLAGSGRILAQDVPMTDLSAGSTVLIPAALNNARAQLRNGAWLLRVKLPSPLKGLIA